MAYVDVPALKRSLVDQLQLVMPTDWDGNEARIDYAWPGASHQRPLHAWFFNARCLSEPSSMGAGTKRRDQTWELVIRIEAKRQKPAVDGQGRNVGQELADAAVMSVAGMLDDWIARNPKLGQTTAADVPVDYASFASFTLEEGVVDTGVGAVGTFTFTVRIRPK